MPALSTEEQQIAVGNTVEVLTRLNHDERFYLYVYLWMRSNSITDRDVFGRNGMFTDSSNWTGGMEQMFLAELAAMWDLYGSYVEQPDDEDTLAWIRKTIRGQNSGSEMNAVSSQPRAVLEAVLALCRCRFWRLGFGSTPPSHKPEEE